MGITKGFGKRVKGRGETWRKETYFQFVNVQAPDETTQVGDVLQLQIL